MRTWITQMMTQSNTVEPENACWEHQAKISASASSKEPIDIAMSAINTAALFKLNDLTCSTDQTLYFSFLNNQLTSKDRELGCKNSKLESPFTDLPACLL